MRPSAAEVRLLNALNRGELEGEHGRDGAAGRTGKGGAKGEIGERGPQGERGPRGPVGPKGDPGVDGEPGPAGIGADGRVLVQDGDDVVGYLQDKIVAGRNIAISSERRQDGVKLVIEATGTGTGSSVTLAGRGLTGPAGETGPAGPAGPPITIKDEGVDRGTATTINFVGSGVSASVASSTATVTISGGGGGGGGGSAEANFLAFLDWGM